MKLTGTPKSSVSVVMATHEDSRMLLVSVNSVLAQEGVEIELIVVGDGNPNGVAERLARLSDARIRYIPIDHGGLTKALIVGCKASSHALIARLDVGDFMLPNRLAKQASILSESDHIGLVCSNCSMYTPEGYYLFSTDYDTQSLEQGLREGDEARFISPVHSSVMFSKHVYEEAGGYRSEFYLTQDCDLWTRMLAMTDLFNINEVLTSGVFFSRGLSGRFQQQQKRFKRLVLELRNLRRLGEDHSHVLKACEALSESVQVLQSHPQNKSAGAASNFFMARCLMRQDSQQADLYFSRVLRAKPTHLKGWLFFFVNRLGPKKKSDRVYDFEQMTLQQAQPYELFVDSMRQRSTLGSSIGDFQKLAAQIKKVLYAGVSRQSLSLGASNVSPSNASKIQEAAKQR